MDSDASTSLEAPQSSAVIIRVDSSLRIGTGHVSRCLRVAKEIESKGSSVTFVCARLDGNNSRLISEAGFPVQLFDLQLDEISIPSIESLWSSPSQSVDGAHTIKVADACGARKVLVDHYGLGLEWEELLLGNGLEVVALDDLVNRVHAARTVIKPGLVPIANETSSHSHDRELTGPRYFIVPREYCEVAQNRSDPLQVDELRVMVFFGGVDRDNATQSTVDALIASGKKGLVIEVVVGQQNQISQKLKDRYEQNSLVRIHDSMSSLADLMANCDMAIGAGGVTALERVAARLPSIVFSLAPNQVPVCTQLDAEGLSNYAGLFSEFQRDRFLEVFEEFSKSLSKHERTLRLSRGMIDCLGAKRIAEVLVPSPIEDLMLRRAVADDLLIYYGWVNDQLVRSQSIKSGRVKLSDHERWFSQRLRDPSSRLLIFETNSLPIGQVRFEQSGKDWEISYSLDEVVRGRGWGVSVIKNAVKWLVAEEIAPYVIARVKDSNTASMQALLKAGFTLREPSTGQDRLILGLKTAEVQSNC